MMVEMLVRRVVDGRVQLSVELVDTYRGDTECVTRIRRPVRRTAQGAESSTRPTRSSTIIVDHTVAVDASCLPRKENISTSSEGLEKSLTAAVG